jgi:acyl-CoA dehydrogenase
MDLADAPEEARLRAEIRAWLEGHATPRTAASVDLADDPAAIDRGRRWQRIKWEAGWAGLSWPRAHGGQGRPMIHQIIWDQEAAAFEVPEEAFIVSTMLAGPTIVDRGSAGQRAAHLPSILDGRAIWCQLFSEPGAGSDLAAVSTRAVRDGDSWVVDGQKVWSSGAHYADWGLLLARTNPAAPKRAGLSYFLLDMRTPGITTRPIRQITGAEHFNEVFFDGVRVPHSALLGEPGDGWPIARLTLEHERAGLALRRRVEVEAFVRLAAESTVDGKPAMADPRIRDRVARIWMRAEALRYLSYRSLTAVAHGEPPGPEASARKLASAGLINDVGRLAIMLVGRSAAAADDPLVTHWQRAFLDATARRIAGGSDEIQKNIIGERVLGLPREPSVERGPR